MKTQAMKWLAKNSGRIAKTAATALAVYIGMGFLEQKHTRDTGAVINWDNVGTAAAEREVETIIEGAEENETEIVIDEPAD